MCMALPQQDNIFSHTDPHVQIHVPAHMATGPDGEHLTFPLPSYTKRLTADWLGLLSSLPPAPVQP